MKNAELTRTQIIIAGVALVTVIAYMVLTYINNPELLRHL